MTSRKVFDSPRKRRNPADAQLTPFQSESLRALADQAFSRAAGAALIPNNAVRLLRDANENYPTWLDAMSAAQKWIHFETYILHDDAAGQQFADVFVEKAQQGVQVRLIYDWLGNVGNTSFRFMRRLSKAGVDVRCYNRLNFDTPLGWVSRDHRKVLTVDGEVAYVSGLCVGQMWVGYPEKKIPPWRDTGVEILGPAVVDVERSFADTWLATGAPLPPEEIPLPESAAEKGNVSLRVVASVPNFAGIYRLDQLITAFARNSIWISDAYFIGSSAYVQALRSAAKAGVDVRLLLPGVSDVPGMRAISRAGYRPLLEAGIRVFEWDGSMMHAKTAVADGRWARVGSTNLNITSWLGNRELDVIIEDEGIAAEMESMFLEDIDRSTEIVLSGRRLSHPQPASRGKRPRKRVVKGKTGSAVAGVLRFGHTVSAAITNRRELGPAESVVMLAASGLLTALAAAAFFWPKAVAIPVLALCLWTAISLAVRAYKLYSKRYD
jgi:cardiolipin synthase